jgi:hypothetical protein
MAAVDMPEATATSAGWRDADDKSRGAASPTSLGRLLRLATQSDLAAISRRASRGAVVRDVLARMDAAENFGEFFVNWHILCVSARRLDFSLLLLLVKWA